MSTALGSHDDGENARRSHNLATITIPGKLQSTVLNVPKQVAELHALMANGLFRELTIADKTTYLEAVGSIKEGYSLRAVAILDENTGNMEFLRDDGTCVPGAYIVEQKGPDSVQFYPETLVGNIVPVRNALEMFKQTNLKRQMH